MRRTVGPWRNTDMKGNPLRHETFRGSLTQVAGFMGAICARFEKKSISCDALRAMNTRMLPRPIGHWIQYGQ